MNDRFHWDLIVGPTVNSTALFLAHLALKYDTFRFFHSNSCNNVPVDHTASDEWGR